MTNDTFDGDDPGVLDPADEIKLLQFRREFVKGHARFLSKPERLKRVAYCAVCFVMSVSLFALIYLWNDLNSKGADIPWPGFALLVAGGTFYAYLGAINGLIAWHRVLLTRRHPQFVATAVLLTGVAAFVLLTVTGVMMNGEQGGVQPIVGLAILLMCTLAYSVEARTQSELRIREEVLRSRLPNSRGSLEPPPADI